MLTLRETFQHLRWDLARYRERLGQPALAIVLLFPGFQAIALYRISHWLNTRGRKGAIWWPLIVVEALITRLVEISTGIYISPNAQIGPGLYFPHFGCIFIGDQSVIGRNCDIYQGVTIGYGGRRRNGGYPVLGDRVFVAAGAKVLGPIQVGDDAVIGANAVVTKSADARAVLVGVPARAHAHTGSFDMIRYPGYLTDPQRQASLCVAEQPCPQHLATACEAINWAELEALLATNNGGNHEWAAPAGKEHKV